MAEIPTQYEQYLMDLFSFPNVAKLREWLDGAENVDWLQATEGVYSQYATQEEQDHTQLEELSATLSQERRQMQ